MSQIDALLERNRSWANSVTADDPEFFSKLATGQQPGRILRRPRVSVSRQPLYPKLLSIRILNPGLQRAGDGLFGKRGSQRENRAECSNCATAIARHSVG